MAIVPLLSARGLVKSFGGRRVLDGLDLELADGARIGVLGPNGGGKSTLLRDPRRARARPTPATVTRRRGLVHAFLPQEVAGDERTPLATVLAARPELAELEAELHAAERRLADPRAGRRPRRDDPRARPPGAAARALDEAGGDRAEGEARMHLRELGIDDDVPTRQLSGGQRKLVALAACLARRPDVLLLDEPEAHLDMRRRDQLERLVDDFDGAVLMVSHDRHLLDECVSAIAELDRGRVRIWPGAYSAYTVARQLEMERQQQQLRDPAEGDRAPGGGDPPLPPLGAHPRQRAHDHAGARQAECRSTRWRRSSARCSSAARWRSRCAAASRGGQRVLALEGVDVAFGDDPVLLDVDLVVMRGERVGVVGPNGAGKTVLVRVLAGDSSRAPGARWAGAGHRRRLPLPGRRRAGPRRDGDRRAARRPLARRGRRGAAADGASCSTTSRSAARSRRSAAASARAWRSCC